MIKIVSLLNEIQQYYKCSSKNFGIWLGNIKFIKLREKKKEEKEYICAVKASV
jgi:hypothetical protein